MEKLKFSGNKIEIKRRIMFTAFCARLHEICFLHERRGLRLEIGCEIANWNRWELQFTKNEKGYWNANCLLTHCERVQW